MLVSLTHPYFDKESLKASVIRHGIDYNDFVKLYNCVLKEYLTLVEAHKLTALSRIPIKELYKIKHRYNVIIPAQNLIRTGHTQTNIAYFSNILEEEEFNIFKRMLENEQNI